LPIVLGAAQPEQVTSAAADQLIFFAVDANPSCESSREQHPLILSVRTMARTSRRPRRGLPRLGGLALGRDPGEVVMVSRWRSREDFSRDMRSEQHSISHGRNSCTQLTKSY
jgi:hypothetical protein